MSVWFLTEILPSRGVIACLLVLVSAPVSAQDHNILGCFGFTGFDFGRITLDMVKPQPSGAAIWHCSNEECRARRDLACVANAMAHRVRPDTMGYNTRADADRHWVGYGRVIRAFGRTHPKRIPLYCSLLTQVARRMTGQEDEYDRTARNVMDLAIQIDRPGNRCYERVREAFPDIPAVQEKVKKNTRPCLPDIQACQRFLDDVNR